LTNIVSLEDGSAFFGWNAGIQNFTESAIWVAGEKTWYDGGGNAPVSDPAPRGGGYFIQNAGAGNATLTLVGEVPQGLTTVTIPNLYGFLGDVVPASGEIRTNGFPIADGATIQTYDAVTGYTEALIGVAAENQWYDGGGNAPVVFSPAVGQGFVHYTTSGSAPWNRNFTVQ
jgi:hypothetical protein